MRSGDPSGKLNAKSAWESAVDYPEYNVPPISQLITASEVLCWIGYRRAISKEQYLAPLLAEGRHVSDPEAFLHTSVPEPRSPQSPMEAAERELMTSLRAGCVRAFYIDHPTGMRAEVPRSDYDPDVVVTIRGTLEVDSSVLMDMGRYMLTRSQPERGSLWFLASEMLAQWPPQATPKPGKPSQENVNEWILNAYQTARSQGAIPPKQQVLSKDCAANIQATSRQVKAAFSKVPDTLKQSRGKPPLNRT